MAVEIRIPAIGDFAQVEVIEVLVKEGDSIEQETSLITLESDKAAMDIPSPQAGVVQKMHVAAGDKVAQGDLILSLEAGAAATSTSKVDNEPEPQQGDPTPQPAESSPASPVPEPQHSPSTTADQPAATTPPATQIPMPTWSTTGKLYASPTVRRLARELGADLHLISGTGPKQRITKDDVKQFIRSALSFGIAASSAATAATAIPAEIDFSQFGAIETEARPRIAILTAQNMHRSWSTIPHVTQFNEADITELESFRKGQQEEATARGVKLTLVSFMLKAIATALQEFPVFNTSLSADGKSLVRKQYHHIGMAVNGPTGLVVPVIRDVDKKGIYQIAREVQEMATLARERKLKQEQMNGGCFTLSSLGGLGGLQFTPIINPPEVAILGVSHSIMRPIYNKQNHSFDPRLMLPMALSYDHRVVNGVDGAKFNQYLERLFGDVPRIML
ncbi:MAG: 2-oxo acid dehydrogenase subunit E2 [Candidatus Porifericomitaceae bacterium WSBS_2022_MAG_OTU9]